MWIDAVNAGDLARLLTLMTGDVVFLNPGQAPFGRDGFSTAFLAAHKQAVIRCISASGATAQVVPGATSGIPPIHVELKKIEAGALG